jgi:low affinity Fe/Cu permease
MCNFKTIIRILPYVYCNTLQAGSSYFFQLRSLQVVEALHALCSTLINILKLFMKKNFFDRFSDWAVCFTGSAGAFIGASLLVVVWGATGPVFKFSETWQMVINTGTTIITFLMVFLIQKAQNKDSKAIQIKLNELVASHEKASNRIVDIEDLTEDELDQLHKFYENLGRLHKKVDAVAEPIDRKAE